MSNGVTNSGSLTIPRELWERYLHPTPFMNPILLSHRSLVYVAPFHSDHERRPLTTYSPLSFSSKRYPPLPFRVWRISSVQFPWRPKVILVTSTRPDVARLPRWILNVLSEIIKMYHLHAGRHDQTSITWSPIIAKWRNVLSTYFVSIWRSQFIYVQFVIVI